MIFFTQTVYFFNFFHCFLINKECASLFRKKTANENKQYKETKTLKSKSYLIRKSLQGYRCKMWIGQCHLCMESHLKLWIIVHRNKRLSIQHIFNPCRGYNVLFRLWTYAKASAYSSSWSTLCWVSYSSITLSSLEVIIRGVFCIFSWKFLWKSNIFLLSTYEGVCSLNWEN